MDALWMIVLTVGLLGSHCEGAISCKNENIDNVDWFILYKKPAGFDYVYIDSTDQKLKKNNKPVNHQDGVLAHTLKPYFERTPDSAFIAYNDQPPGCNAEQEKGHSKGVVMMDEDNVVWLLHSTPKFPEGDESNNFYPKSGERNAQIFMCVTLKSAQSAQIAQHLKDINAYVFDKHNPKKLRDSSNEARKRPYHKDLLSAGGEKFTRFVKNITNTSVPKEGDLYFYIADTLDRNLYIQTWRSKPEDTDITDKKKHLYNIVKVQAGDSEWEYKSDHSKWCVSDSKDWMCVGDSNREPSQFERPGGALCINSRDVADAFWKIKTEDSSMEPPLKKKKPSSG